MSSRWEEFVDHLKDDTGKLAKAELKDLIRTAKNDSELFLREQGIKLDRYLNQLALSQITKGQFEGYMRDIQDLTEMQALKMSVAAKARAQRLVQGVTDLIINGLLALI